MIVTFSQGTGYTVVEEGKFTVTSTTNPTRQILDQQRDQAVSGVGNLTAAHAENTKRWRPTGSGYALS